MELKKVKWLKFISIIAIFAVMIFCTGLNVHAENVKDGISVTVSSDKEKYNSEDEVNLKITVKNTNDFEVSDIKVENILPDGISLVSGEKSKDNINLKANEEVSMNLTVKKANSGQAETKNITTKQKNTTINTTVADDTVSTNEKFPNTGENSTTLIAMIVMLISIVIMIVCLFLKDRKKYSKFLSVLICLGVINAFGITGIVHASSKNNNSFTYEYTYKIDNTDYIHKVVISYSVSENNNNSNNNNNNNTYEEKKLQDGYLVDIKDNFVSSYNFEKVKWDKVDKNSLDYLLLKNVYIKIENAKYQGNNTGTANIVITAPDLEDLLISSLKALGLNPDEEIKGEEFQKDKDKIKNSMCDILKNGNYKKIETSFNVNVTKINNIWQIEYDEDVHEEITCRVNGLFEKYVDKMFKGE